MTTMMKKLNQALWTMSCTTLPCPGRYDYKSRILLASKPYFQLLFAFIPPTDYCGGWICFVVSIIGVGVLTAVSDFSDFSKFLKSEKITRNFSSLVTLLLTLVALSVLPMLSLPFHLSLSVLQFQVI